MEITRTVSPVTEAQLLREGMQHPLGRAPPPGPSGCVGPQTGKHRCKESFWGEGRCEQGGWLMSRLEVGRSLSTNVSMEPVRNPVIPPIRYGNQQLDSEDARGGCIRIRRRVEIADPGFLWAKHGDLKEHPVQGKLINPPEWNPHCKIFFSAWAYWQLEPAGSASSPGMTADKKLGSKTREEKPSSVCLIKLSADAAWESREIKQANIRCHGRGGRSEHFSNPWIWQPAYMK